MGGDRVLGSYSSDSQTTKGEGGAPMVRGASKGRCGAMNNLFLHLQSHCRSAPGLGG